MSETGDPDTQAAIKLAVEDINAYFSENGSVKRVHLTVKGTGLDPDKAVEKITLLSDLGLNIIIGPESSGELEALKPFADTNDIVILSHCSTAPSLAVPGDNIYRMVPSDNDQSEAIAKLIYDEGYNVIVPMWRTGVWGEGISYATVNDFSGLGGTVYPGVSFDPEKEDYSSELAVLKAQIADAGEGFGDSVAVALFSFGTEGARVLAQASEIKDLSTVKWFGSDGTALSREILTDPKAVKFAIATGFYNTLFAEVETPEAVAVRERISAETAGGSVHFCATAAYDAVWLAALTAAETGTSDIERFKHEFTEIAGSYEGATGRIKFNTAGDRADALYDVWAIIEENGQTQWKRIGVPGNGQACINY